MRIQLLIWSTNENVPLAKAVLAVKQSNSPPIPTLTDSGAGRGTRRAQLYNQLSEPFQCLPAEI
jgi:hypothetical protein